MERQIPENPYSPAYEAPDDLLNPFDQLYLSTEEQPRSTLMVNLHTADQAIESAFSRMTLNPGFQPHSQTSSYPSLPDTLDAVPSAEPVPRPLACGERQQTLCWARPPNNNGGASGPFGAHQNLVVGPEAVGFGGTGPNIDADAPLKLMRYHDHQRPHFCDATWDKCQGSSLHGKEPFSSSANSHFPVLPSAWQSNFRISRSSFLYNNQPLYQWHQQLTLGNMRGRIVALATDQVLSGVLNLKLEEGLSEGEIEMILQEVMGFLVDLMTNQCGSHFVQKLFVACNEDQRTRIIMALTRFPLKLVSICLNSYGTRAVQKLLERLSTPQIPFIISALSLGTIVLASDPNGQHVIQYCVKHFPGEYNKCLLTEIANNCLKIATNKIGCCVLQSCMEKSEGKAREQLINEIKSNALHLAQDPYGNYVVQHLLGMRMQDVIADLLRRFQGYFASLSCNKYASNVVEKFLLESEENHSATIIMELLTSSNASMLLLDPYANFVIQSALSVSKGHVREALLNFIQGNALSMQSNLYGKKILAWFEKSGLHNA